MTSTHMKGAAAENLAQKYLLEKGWNILATNWHSRHLELDIIAMDGDELVIVEVKSRIGIRYEHPYDAVNERKIKRIIDAADDWITINNSTAETRFDIITIVFYDENFELEHFVNAFYPTL